MAVETKGIEAAPQYEQETICNYDYMEDSWSIYTNVRKHITRLSKVIGEERFDMISRSSDGRITEVHIDGLKHSQVSFRKESKPMSEERKAQAAENLRKARG